MSSDSDVVDSSSSEDEQDPEQELDGQQVTGANADPQVLQYFWDLASLEQATRQASAGSLVAALIESQKQHESSQSADAQPGGSLQQQEGGNRQQRMESCLNCCSPLMAYGLKRLGRGLASSRQGARQGFAAALATALAHSAAAAAAAHNSSTAGATTPLQRPFISTAGVLALLEACLEVTGSMKGSDQRDALLGRVFGLAALARSGLVAALPAGSSTDPAAATAVHGVAAVAEQLVGLLQRKAFLRESAAAALVELLSPLTTDQMQQVLSQAPKLTSFLQVQPQSATPEALFVALRLWHNIPPQQLQNCQLLPSLPAAPPPEQFWQQPAAVQRSRVEAAAAAVFAVGHVKALCPALLATTASHPRLHPVWGCMLALLMPGFIPVRVLQAEAEQSEQQQQPQSRTAPDPQHLSHFWQNFVEASCLNSSHERKALALQLLQLLLPVVTPETVPVLLSKPVLQCVSTALRNKESYLHASARKSMDRINSCAEHSLIAKSDPAIAAKLRLALAAQLQSANLQHAAAAGPGKAKAQQGVLQGLDTAGVAAYVEQLLREFVQAVKQAGRVVNGADAGDASSEDEDMPDADVDDTKAKQLLDQLTAALRFPAADSSTLRQGLTFLAAAAFLQLPAKLNTDALATSDSAAAAAAAAAVTPAGKTPGKKQKGSKGAAAVAAADDPLQLEKQVLQSAADMQPQPQPQLRQQCAARLITLLHSLQHRAGQQQQQTGAKDEATPADETKKQKKARQQAQQEQAAAAARHAAWQQQEVLTTQILKLVAAAQDLKGVQPTADEDITEMVQQLQQLSAAVMRHTQQQHQQQQAAKADTAAATATRCRVVLQLVHQLQLQLLAGGLTAEAAGSVVDDLEIAVVQGLGMNSKGLGTDPDAVAAAAAAGAGSSSEDAASDQSGSGSDDDTGADGEPAWQDVLLDLLIALLSNSSSADAAKGGAVLVPTAPLREACEAVFRAFAEDVTAQGLTDMLRVLSKRASEEIKKDDDEDDSEVEMEVDQSEEEQDQSDVADQDQSEVSEDEAAGSDDQSEAAAPADQKAAGSGSGAAGSDAEADEASSDLDDEAMLRLDAQLGAAVKSMLQRSGGSAKERAAALLGLQLRVAALLEEWLKKCHRSPLVPQITLPLLKALVAARGAGGNPTLADRLASILSKQLSKCRPVLVLQPGQQPAEAVQAPCQQYSLASFEADLRKVLYYASREKDPRVSAAASQALLVLLHAGGEAADAAVAAAVQATAAAALADFFDKKKSRLQRPWCEQLLSRCHHAVLSGDAAGLQAILTACSKGRNESVRSKAAALLPVLFRTGSQQQQQEVLLPALQKHQVLLAAALGAPVAGPYKSKEQHAAAVKAVVSVVQGVGKLAAGKRLAEVLGSETIRELGKVVVVVKAAGVAPRVESQLDRLVDIAGLQQLVSAGKADPARLALLKKQRTALEGKAAAGKGQQPKAEEEEQQQQVQEKKQKKDKKQEQQQQQENGDEAAAVGKRKKAKEGENAKKKQRKDKQS